MSVISYQKVYNFLKILNCYAMAMENIKVSIEFSNVTNAENISKPPLDYKIIAECSKSKARCSLMTLPHCTVELPMFMPVGTQGTMKGLLPEQVTEAGCQIILGNTYHLGTRPGKKIFDKFGGLHNFMQWDRALLSDSGGFQMVSLLQLAEITEEGVKFKSPYNGSECLLTPEESIAIQNSIGTDIIMQLDDVVHVMENDYERFKDAVYRTTRWYDRCCKAHKKPETQSLFPIVQGGTFPELRKISLEELVVRDAPGYAIGGLSGGEEKEKFWPIIHQCTDYLPREKPRYCMGIGFAVDLVVCCALGADMFDCVYPTRTARFGCALVDGGQINLKGKEYSTDFQPIDDKCTCTTCKNYSRAFLHTIVTRETVACHLLSIHNLCYQMSLMKNIRESIKAGTFEKFVKSFMATYYEGKEIPKWIVDALATVNIFLEHNTIKSSVDLTSSSGLPSQLSTYNVSAEIWGKDEEVYCDKEVIFNKDVFSVACNRGFQEGILQEFNEERKCGRSAAFKHAVSENYSYEVAKLLGYLTVIQHRSGKKMTTDQKRQCSLLKTKSEDILVGLSKINKDVICSTLKEHFGECSDLCAVDDWNDFRNITYSIQDVVLSLKSDINCLIQDLHWKAPF